MGLAILIILFTCFIVENSAKLSRVLTNTTCGYLKININKLKLNKIKDSTTRHISRAQQPFEAPACFWTSQIQINSIMPAVAAGQL